MAFVITRLCRDCVDGACVEVCPISDCIVEHRPAPGEAALPNQLFINPEECIDCGCCEPVCPWEAIALDDDVPRQFADDIALNALAAARPRDFVPATIRTRAKPSPAEVDANRRRWEDAACATLSEINPAAGK
jgi:ferredoxin